MKKIAILSLIIFIILIIIKFNIEKKSSRDYLNFYSSTISIEESIYKMNKLIVVLSRNNNDVSNYILLDDNNLIVNNKRIGVIDSINKIEEFSQSQTKEFLNLVKFFLSNKIKSCYLELNSGVVLYDYQRDIDGSDGVTRQIYLNENEKDYSIILANRIILDKQGKLVLIK